MTRLSETIPLPPLPQDAPGRPKDNRYRRQFGVIIICADEPDQRAVYEALADCGRPRRVVTT